MRLVLKVLPWVAVVMGSKATLDAAGWTPLELNALMSGIVAGNVFLLGFLLSGTLSDFKESERLPGELASSLDSMGDECLLIARDPGARAALGCLAHLRETSRSVRAWLCGENAFDDALRNVRALNDHFLALSPSTQATFINRMKGEQAALRKALIRVETIQRTSFVGAGYVIAQILTILLLAGLVVTEIGEAGPSLFFVGVLAFLLLFMNKLIRDLDNPFEYGDGSAEVSLEPLTQVEDRLAAAIADADSAIQRTELSPAAALPSAR